MATETAAAAAPAAAKPGITGNATATASPAPGVVASNEISTDQLARNLAEGRKDKEKKEQATAVSTNSRANEGLLEDEEGAPEDLNQGKTAEEIAAEAKAKAEKGKDGGGTPPLQGDFKAGLQTLGLNAVQTAAVEKALADGGGELDAEALGFTEAQVAGLTKLLDAPAEGAAAPEVEALDLSQVTKLSPEQARHVQGVFGARIGKVIATERAKAEAAVKVERDARTAAETANGQLQQQLAQAKSAPAAASAIPLVNVTTAEQLQAAAANARAVKTWAQTQLRHVTRNPDAVKTQLETAGVKLAEYTPEAMEDYLNDALTRADDTLTQQVPQRQQYLQQEQQFTANVSKDHPWLDDPKDERYAYTQGALQMFPELKRVPHWKAILAVIGTGIKAMNDAKAANTARTKLPAIKIIPRKPGKVTVRPGGARSAAAGKDTGATEADEQFKSTGSVADLAKRFGAKRNAA